jgi:uncharacterized heparinase superfamily protein
LVNATVAEEIRGALMLARGVGGWTWRKLALPWRHALAMRPATPERLLISPQDIRTSDPTVAADIYEGYYAFAGKIVNAHGRSPFEISPPSRAWAAALASFGWLRHLRAADTALARANARALVDDFLTQSGRNRALPVRDPRVVARRLMAWLSQSPMLLEGADRVFYRRFMRALGRDAAVLQAALGDRLQAEDRIFALIALAELALCSEGLATLQKRYVKLLADELTRQILPDGGHRSRNPQTLVNLLLDLLPLRQIFAARGVVAPPALLNAIDRMLPMLRLLRLDDGSLALFNGMGATQPHVLATVHAYDDPRAVAPTNAPHSGYQRLAAGGAALVMETGAAPEPEFSCRAHAGQLSFEFCSDGQRFVGNCGSPNESRADMRAAARATAAHSTLVLADTSSSRFAPATGPLSWLGERILSGPARVTVTREDSAEGPALRASHDGYVARFARIHERTLRIATDGGALWGTDRLEPVGERRPGQALDYAVRFHLHPAVRAQKADDGQGVWLWLPDGAVWLFRAAGAAAEIEPSIFFAAPDGARGAEQIVLQANAELTPGVEWSFERISPSSAG